MKPARRSAAALIVIVLAAGAATQWWRAAADQRLGARLATFAQAGDIRMLSSESCVYCAAARRWMTLHGVRHDECFIERDAQCKLLYDATQARGTPTLIVRGKVQLGFDAAQVLAALEARG